MCRVICDDYNQEADDTGIQWLEAKDAAKYPTTHDSPPSPTHPPPTLTPQQIIQPKMSVVLRMRKPALIKYTWKWAFI